MEPTPSPAAAAAVAEGELAAEERTLAAWGQRLGAYIADSLVLTAVAGVPALVVGALSDAGIWVWYGLIVVLPAVYFTYFHGRERAQTPGKMLLGIRVEDDDRRQSIGYGRAFVRWLVPNLFGVIVVPWLLNYLWPLWDKKKQAWHDKIAGSVVVRA